MASTEDRIRTLITEHLDLGREPDFDARFSEAGVASVDAVAFFKVVEREFALTLSSDALATMQTLRDLVDYIDAHAG